MLISSWLKSFRYRLQSSPRRMKRQRVVRYSGNAELLENRALLTSPFLQGAELAPGQPLNQNDVLSISPPQLTLQFDAGQIINPATVNSSTIVVTGAGGDGLLGTLDDRLISSSSLVTSAQNEVLVQFNTRLTSDLYRITIEGDGTDRLGNPVAPLANSLGEAFNNDTDDTFDFEVALPPPTLVSVRPNVSDILDPGDTLNIAPNDLILQFNPGQNIDASTVNTSTVFVERAGHDGTFGDGNEVPISIGFVGIGDTPEEVIVRFAENLQDDRYRIIIDGDGLDPFANSVVPLSNIDGDAFNDGADDTFVFNLDLGARIVAIDPQPVTRNPDGSLTQVTNQIVLYFNEDELLTGNVAGSVEDEGYYQLIFTNDTVTNLDDALTGNFHSPTLAEYDSAANTVTLTFASAIDQLSGAGTYRLRVGNKEPIPLAPIETTVGVDPGSSYATADTTLGDISASGNSSQIISSSIDPQAYPFVFPGANTDPGNREIEVESHLLGGADSLNGVSQIDYNFRLDYGFDPLGNALSNTITEPQKQRVREVFEYYGTLLGIDFRETANQGLTIVTGDLRALDPTVPTGQGGVIGLAGGGIAIMDQAETWDDTPGADYFSTAMHEIGHLLGLGHTYELPALTVQGSNGAATVGPVEPDYPGDNDLVHGLHLHRTDSVDIDMYEFDVTSAGLFTAEIVAERLADSSSLDSQTRLFRENPDGTRELIAQNDDYFSEDSFIEVFLEPGKYFIGVSSTGNGAYDPIVEGTGFGGTSQGNYDLRVNFRAAVSDTLLDATGTSFDGEGDGVPGGVYNFWFRATAPTDTLFVDRGAISVLTQAVTTGQTVIFVEDVGPFAVNDVLIIDNEQVQVQSVNAAANSLTVQRAVNGSTLATHNIRKAVQHVGADGSEASPFGTIREAVSVATEGQIVRIVGNGGVDDDISTIDDNYAYLIGKDTNNSDLRDGSTFEVPKGVTVMIDAGAVLKLRNARIGVGSSSSAIDRSGAALQVLGTPGNQVIFTSHLDESIGNDTTNIPTTPAGGNWGGISFRNDVDRAEGRFNYQSEGIFLNYIGQSDIRYGGGNVIVDSVLQTINPIHMTRAQPTVSYNTITNSSDSAMSADPDSFEEITFHAPRFQDGAAAFTSDYTRVGPDLHWNTLIDNSTNGIFIRVVTVPGSPRKKLTVPGRFDDTDIVHYIGQNLQIQGTPGGPRLQEVGPNVQITTLTPTINFNGTLAAGTYNYILVFIDENGFESPASQTTLTVDTTTGGNAVLLQQIPPANSPFVGRRLYRSANGAVGPYTLVAELDRSDSAFVDLGFDLQRTLNPVSQRTRARRDARLSIDAGVIVKLDDAGIQTGLGAQFIAEGQLGREVIITSRLDDRYGAGGTFDTNDDGDLVGPLQSFFEDQFNSATFDPTRWAVVTDATIDDQGIGEPSGTQSARLNSNPNDGDLIRSVDIDLSGQTDVDVLYSYQRTGLGDSPAAGEDLILEFRNSAGAWVEVSRQPGSGPDMVSYENVVVPLPTAAFHLNFAIRFRVSGSAADGSFEDWFVDNVEVREGRSAAPPTAGDWGGIYIGHLGSASIDHAFVAFGGGVIPVESDFAGFNAIEIHQAEARIRNTRFEDNATGVGGTAPGNRFGLFSNQPGTIFVRGAQPIILANEFLNNDGPVISINANALNGDTVTDYGRSTGFADLQLDQQANQGALVRNNRLSGNGINAMQVRGETLTTEVVFDDVDIVHAVFNEIFIPDHHHFGGLRLESSSTQSLVVKFQGPNAGITANGYPLDIDDRIGGSVQIIGQPGQPVILTSFSDDTVGAGFDLNGVPLRDTNNDGPSSGTAGDWRSVRIDQYAHDRNVSVYIESEVAGRLSADTNNTIENSEVIGLLATDEYSGDETLRLGFEIHGVIDSPNDTDIYSFDATPGTTVWFDIDRTSQSLDSVIELLDSDGNILAVSNNVNDAFTTDAAARPTSTLPYSPFNVPDLYTLNALDAGMQITLSGTGNDAQTYFVRVRSSNYESAGALSAPTTIFTDDFSFGPTFDPAKWANVSTAEIDTGAGSIAPPSAPNTARLNGNPNGGDVIESVTMDVTGSDLVEITYSFQQTGNEESPDFGDDLVLEYMNAAGLWVEVDRQLGSGPNMTTFQQRTVSLPGSAVHANFAFRFRSIGTAGAFDDWFIDDVQVATRNFDISSLLDPNQVNGGLTTGSYELQLRLSEVDEFEGSAITYADIRYATNGIEIFGQPAHSPLAGESTEFSNSAGVTSVTVGNLMNSDRAALYLAGRLEAPGTDIDFWEFEVRYDATQTIADFGVESPHVPVTIDLDFADGFGRADTTVALFTAAGELILLGRDSNIADDQPKPLNGPDTGDLSRGTNGKLDPFIGPVELIGGTYRLAVFATTQIPTVLNQYWERNPAASLIRLEPVNSTVRIAEERFGPSTTVFDFNTGMFVTVSSDTQSTASAPITDLFTVDAGGDLDPKHAVPFHLGDVTLFVSTFGGTKGNDESTIRTIDPFTGAIETLLGSFGPSSGDIAMRADGQLHTFSTSPQGGGRSTDGNTGNYIQIDTGTAAATVIGDDGIITNLRNGTAAGTHGAGIQFNAIAYTGTVNNNLWAVGDRSTLALFPGQMGAVDAQYNNNILYNFNLATGAQANRPGVNNRQNLSIAVSGAGTTQVEYGFVDTQFSNGGLNGQITGMVELNGTFYAVDDAGGLYTIDPNSFSTFVSPVDPVDFFGNPNIQFNRITTTFIRHIGADAVTGAGGLNLQFEGLALGPQNVENGAYSQTLFGITSSGDIYAFDANGELQPIFVDGQQFISTGLNSVTGLDFGTLDYNLWHISTQRGGNGAADDGHGIDVAPFDNSIFLPDPGGASLYFGFENGGNSPDPSLFDNRTAGNKNTNGDNTLSTAEFNNVNFPGGAHGSIVSNQFSLEGYSADDKPVLYFNYFLDTEDQDYVPPGAFDDPMRDAFRVFISDESGAWNLLVTNDSFQDSARSDEFDLGPDGTFTQQPVTQTHPDVVEAFDESGWRQARVDLSNYAGRAGLQLRFDFSTAGEMNLGDITTTGSELYAVPATELLDGDTITIDSQVFEFDLGAHLYVPSGGAALGESFTVFGTTFTYVATTPASGTEIQVFPDDTAAEVAQRSNDALNAFFPGTTITVPAGNSLEGESFTISGTTFTYTTTPTTATDIDIQRIPNSPPSGFASSDTVAARTTAVVNNVLGAGSAFTNGSNVDFPGVTVITFGGSLNVTSGATLEGESFTVLGTTFTYTQNPLLATDIDISLVLMDPTSGFATSDTIATRTAAVINTAISGTGAFVDSLAPSRVSVPDLPTIADGFFTGGTLYVPATFTPDSMEGESFTVFGTTFTFTTSGGNLVTTLPTDIEVDPADTTTTLAIKIRDAINSFIAAGTAIVDPLAPNRVSVPRLPGLANSFIRGGTMLVQNVPNLQNYEFEIRGQKFRFTNNPTQTGDILTRATDQAIVVAQEAVRIINLVLGAGSAFQSGSRISVPDLPSAADGIFQGTTLDFSAASPLNVEGDSFTVFGTTFTFTTRNTFGLPNNAVDIDYTGAADAEDIAALAAAAINTRLASQGLSPRATINFDTTGELVGIDFGPVADVAPANWNQADGNSGADFVLTDLIDEAGVPTVFDLTVAYGGGSGPGTSAGAFPGSQVPTHTNPLDEIGGLLSDESGLTLTFSDLTPGTNYEIYVFGGDPATSFSQDVTITGAGAAVAFTQAWTNDLYVNDQAGTAAQLNTFVQTVTADALGRITIQIDETTAGDDVFVPGVALRRLPRPADTIDVAGAVDFSFGTSMMINGPTAAVTNGDTITVNGITFTYVGGAPANGQEIQTNDTESITGDNTVTQLNNLFGPGTAFRSGFRVNLPNVSQITYTDSGSNGSIHVSDYARLRVNAGEPLAGDTLVINGFTFTFVDTQTPAILEIGNQVAGTWVNDDIVAAVDAFFGAGSSAVILGPVVQLFINPSFFGPLVVYNDQGDGGLTIFDDGTGGSPVFSTLISRPQGFIVFTDESGSPFGTDFRSTPLTHDLANAPITTVSGAFQISEVTDNRVTIRSADDLTVPSGSSLSASGQAGTGMQSSGPDFIVSSSDPVTLDGDTIEIFGATFTFVNGVPASSTEIRTDADPNVVAGNIETVIDNFFTGFDVITVFGSLVTNNFSGTFLYTDSAAGDEGLTFGGGGTTPSISVSATMTPNQVAIAIRQSLAEFYSGGDLNNIKGHEELIQVIGHTVSDNGPLGFAGTLPGDTFGAFTDGFINGQALRPGSLRGMDNVGEGIYIDDIIIGFAERGEMVTNAPVNTSFTDNDDVLNPDLPAGNIYLGITDGPYDVEIRHASEIGTSQTPDPTNILERAIDTNDREAKGFAITVPAGHQIPDKSTFTIADGIDRVTFQFVDAAGASVVDPGFVPIVFNSIQATAGTFEDGRESIASLMLAAINSQPSQDKIAVQAVFSGTSAVGKTLHLTGNAIISLDSNLAAVMTVTAYDTYVTDGTVRQLKGDQNRKREQGQIIVQSTFVSDSSNIGILVDASPRGGLNPTPHPGAVRNTQQLNTERLVTGVVIMNNVIVENNNGGIRFSGDSATTPRAAVPYGRIVNNTIVGDGNGVGIQVDQNAAPTLLNNIVTNFTTGISVDASSSGTVIGSTLYQNNAVNSNAGLGSFAIQLAPTDPLFLSPATRNYYPAPNSQAIDSSLSELADRNAITTVKSPLNIGISPIVVPDRDVFGQLRGDDQDVTNPFGQGNRVFLDRGAIDRVDFFDPSAVLFVPEDQSSDDLDPDIGIVWINLPNDLTEFVLRLNDAGIGIDDANVRSTQFLLEQDGVPLQEGVDYIYRYNSVSNEVIFSSVTAFPFERSYTITVANTPGTNGVRDLAGNFLAANQPDGTTVFQILVTDGVNDPPINAVPDTSTVALTVDEDADLSFSGFNEISVSDADVHLGNNRLQVTLTAVNGTVTLNTGISLSLFAFTAGDGVDDVTMTFEGDVDDINAALAGSFFTGDAEYSGPASVTITTDDLGQFTGPPSSAASDTDVINIDVLPVNDPPTFTIAANPGAVNEDAGAQSVAGFVTAISPGPADEMSDGQTVSFTVTVQSTTGNLAFSAAPAIDASGNLTYTPSPDTNGTAIVRVVAVDTGSPAATSAPQTFTIVVNALNDAPVFAFNNVFSSGNILDSIEDDITRTIDLVQDSSIESAVATATDEVGGQRPLTFSIAGQSTVVGNVTFSQLSIDAATGDLTFKPTPDTSGQVDLTITLTDSGPIGGSNVNSVSAVVRIDVVPTPDSPIASTPNYTIDEGDAVMLDGSATFDADVAYPGDPLTYEWDLNGDGVYDVSVGTPTTTVTYSTLTGLGLSAPSTNAITLRVTDTFAGTSSTDGATLTLNAIDYGDAPDTYLTTKAVNGAAHILNGGTLFLGPLVDQETDGNPTADATGDDTTGVNDNDGVILDPNLQSDPSVDVPGTVHVIASAAGRVDLWLDLNNDGSFDHPSEHLGNGTSFDVVAGTNRIDFVLPAGTPSGIDTFLRVRISSTGNLLPSGRAADGEVEDYQVHISPVVAPAPVTVIKPAGPQTSDLTPTIAWETTNPALDGSNYFFDVVVRDAGGTTVYSESKTTASEATVSADLTPGDYTATVTPYNRVMTAGSTSAAYAFTVVPLVVSGPVGDVIGAPTIEWNEIVGTATYEIQINSVTTGTQNVFVQTGLPNTSTTFTLPGELDLGSYEARVRAIDDCDHPGDWSAFVNFAIVTPPIVIAPIGATADPTPLIDWTAVQGAATYRVIVDNLTDNLPAIVDESGVATNSFQITSDLFLADYSITVQAFNAQGESSNISASSTFRIAPTPVAIAPLGRLDDSTPTFGWNPIVGAESYRLRVWQDFGAGDEVINNPDITGTTFTSPIELPLGRYNYEVTAINRESNGSVSGDVESPASAVNTFTVTAAPTLLNPNPTIYDTTPTINWVAPPGAVRHEIWFNNVTTNQAAIIRDTNIPTNSYTVAAQDALTPGNYRVWVRSFADAAGTIASDWSLSRSFRVGQAPVLLAPTGRVNTPKPTLSWIGAEGGETYRVWVSNVTQNQRILLVENLDSASLTVPNNLDNGLYRFWVQANSGFGEDSAWSTSLDFRIVTAPRIQNTRPSTFDGTPTITWTSLGAGALRYEIWVNDLTRGIPRVIHNTNVPTNSFTPASDLQNGIYRVWVRGFTQATTSDWSQSYTVEIGGRPYIDPFIPTTNTKPTFTWRPVGEAVEYEVYLADVATPGTAVVRQSGIGSTTFTVPDDLSPGDYRLWVRARNSAGVWSAWSAPRDTQIQAFGTPVLNSVGTTSDRTPVFTWSAVSGAVKYEVWVAAFGSTSTAIVNPREIVTTSYESTVTLGPGNYRVWVRAISSTGFRGAWSVAEAFTVVSNDSDPQFHVPTDQTTLVSLEAADTFWNAEDVAISMLPAVVVDRGNSVAAGEPVIDFVPAGPVVVQVDADHSEARDDDDTDDLMAEWDDAIWSEESAALETKAVEPNALKAGAGWMAGLLGLTGFRARRRRRDEK